MARGLSANTIETLEQAMRYVRSVDYRVSLRWLFYRMVQGHGYQKKDYNRFKSAIAKARKRYIRGWHPAILADETRSIYNPGRSSTSSIEDWVSSVQQGIRCNLDKHMYQQNRVHVWFEAKAMAEQFKKYTAPYFVPLAPFGGDPSIPFKKELADLITRDSRKGQKVVVLYFGDYDKKGQQIPLSALDDVRRWTPYTFSYYRIGLNFGHISRYSIPENPSRKNEYQWEALDDAGARDVITRSLDRFIDIDAITKVQDIERRAESDLASHLVQWVPDSDFGEVQS